MDDIGQILALRLIVSGLAEIPVDHAALRVIANRVVRHELAAEVRERLRLDLTLRPRALIEHVRRVIDLRGRLLPERVEVTVQIDAVDVVLPFAEVGGEVRHLILRSHAHDHRLRGLRVQRVDAALYEGDAVRVHHRNEVDAGVLEQRRDGLSMVEPVVLLHLKQRHDLPHHDLGADVLTCVNAAVHEDLMRGGRVSDHHVVELPSIDRVPEDVHLHLRIRRLQDIEIDLHLLVGVGADVAAVVARRKRYSTECVQNRGAAAGRRARAEQIIHVCAAARHARDRRPEARHANAVGRCAGTAAAARHQRVCRVGAACRRDGLHRRGIDRRQGFGGRRTGRRGGGSCGSRRCRRAAGGSGRCTGRPENRDSGRCIRTTDGRLRAGLIRTAGAGFCAFQRARRFYDSGAALAAARAGRPRTVVCATGLSIGHDRRHARRDRPGIRRRAEARHH